MAGKAAKDHKDTKKIAMRNKKIQKSQTTKETVMLKAGAAGAGVAGGGCGYKSSKRSRIRRQ